MCQRSNDEGLTWSQPSIVSNFPNYFCSNVDFFELPNHDIICSYRAIGINSCDDPDIKYNRNVWVDTIQEMEKFISSSCENKSMLIF